MDEMATEALPEIDAQYRALREEAGMLDRCSRGKIDVRGSDAAEYLQGQLTNDVEGLEEGQGCYAALLDRKGHVQADMRVLRLGEAQVWLDCEQGATEALLRHLNMYAIGREVEISDVSPKWSITSLIGPRAATISGFEGLGPEGAHATRDREGIEVRAVATDLGQDLICRAGQNDELRGSLAAAGAAEVSEAATEIVRVEAGRPRFGAEISSATMPAEVGIVERAVDFEKGCYIGQEPVARLHYRGKPNRRLCGLRFGAAAEPGQPLFLEEREVGTVGSACVSPARGPIGLAVVRREAEPGATLRIGETGLEAELVELPWVET
jgi:tRNA-modifying protein YgfZ